jgi:hypothetical protein
MKSNKFAAIVGSIEQDIADYYGFTILHRAQDHLVSDELIPEISRLRGKSESFRAAVYFSEGAGELSIGVHFETNIQDCLLAENPKISLSNGNLDAFCVLVEELSHFHLLVNRANADKQLSFLELEWQAEVDKLLFCGIYLERLVGDPHIRPLLKLLFSPNSDESELESHYAQAERFAVKFWLDFIDGHSDRRKCLQQADFRRFMQKNYLESLPEKRRLSDGTPILRVA